MPSSYEPPKSDELRDVYERIEKRTITPEEFCEILAQRGINWVESMVRAQYAFGLSITEAKSLAQRFSGGDDEWALVLARAVNEACEDTPDGEKS